MKGFLQRILQEIMKENDTWNIRRLVDGSFVSSSKRSSVLYCKLKDFKTNSVQWSRVLEQEKFSHCFPREAFGNDAKLYCAKPLHAYVRKSPFKI